MRLILWAPILAAVVEALPGASSSSASPSSSPSSTSSASSAPTSVNEGAMQHACEIGGLTYDNWKDFDMGFFVNTTSNMWCSDEEKCPYGPYKNPWPQSLSTLLPDQTVWECEMDNDDCDAPKKASWCSNDLHAQVVFALQAVKHFHDWVRRVDDAIGEAQLEYATLQVSIVEKFTTHDVSQDTTQATAFTIAAGVFGLVAAFLGPLAPLGIVAEAGVAATAVTVGAAAAGGISGASTLGIAATNAMAPNIAETLQKEITGVGNMSTVMEASFNSARDSIMKYAGQAINEVPSNNDGSTGYSYKDQPGSAPSVLSSGAFAEMNSYKDFAKLKDVTKTMSNMAAISYVWRNYEHVYIAKLAKRFDNVDPCDITLVDLHRECKDGVAYFFIKWQDKSMEDPHWSQPKGLDALDEFDNLDLYTMAQAAEYNQQKYGYDHDWDPTTASEAIMVKDAPPGAMMINLPVCYMDDYVAHYAGKESTHETDLKAILHKECAAIPKGVKDWPYKFIGDNDVGSNFNKNPYTDDAKDSIIYREPGGELIQGPPNLDIDDDYDYN